MSKFSNSVFSSLVLVMSFTACVDEKASEKDQDAAIGAALLSQLSRSGSLSGTSSTTGKFPIPTCEVAAPAFSSLATAGFNSTCGSSGCHDGTTRYNATNYNQVKGYTVAGSPTTSSLYTAQSTGSMAVNTNQSVDKAIYCWILGGSNP
ncbi:LIC11213 family lipoprotein [Leptospira ilyithenensis]|uniref:Cytochrome C Planctomycete-type domain-containing protein n=1 Tax=Leptospira ilyithenensis TaxID=2484901 RepID=A0A4V3JWY1_9LEPT|nr:hypothetical protein [Leptospira ilyithenensis]TGN08228.1 hypothetical protein EHS11_15020 [Leptospira ilyithenensis]